MKKHIVKKHRMFFTSIFYITLLLMITSMLSGVRIDFGINFQGSVTGYAIDALQPSKISSDAQKNSNISSNASDIGTVPDKGAAGANTSSNTAVKNSKNPVCGNGVIENVEQCDEGINNGKYCTPSINDSCSYCSNNCLKVIVSSGAAE